MRTFTSTGRPQPRQRPYTDFVAVHLLIALLSPLAAWTPPVQAKMWHVSQMPMEEVDSKDQVHTIGEAVSHVEAGDTIVVHGGIYREFVRFDRSGTEAAPITLRAAEGEHVVLTGADHITDWTAVPDREHVYVTSWTHRFIAWEEHNTHPGDEFHRLIGRCEQVFINAYPMRQVLERAALARGTFFVDLEAKRLYVRPADTRALTGDKATVEAAARDRIMSVKGNHVTVKGLRFRYAANRAQQGAVELGGNHLNVEDCIFEYTNSSGAEMTGEDITLRRCTFQHNGQLGFGASRAHRLHLIDCICRNNNTKGFDRGWEAGGNKICLSRDVVLEHSTFIENRGNGIWFDIGNENCKVHNCLIASNEDAGIFYEISYGLYAHDNVIVDNGFAFSPGAWGAAAGICLSSSPNCVIERNLLIGNKEGFNFREQTRSTPRLNGGSETVWNQDQVIRHNVLAYNRDAQVWGWFDIADQRHWPKAMQTESTDETQLSLEGLHLAFRNNLYAPGPGQGLFNWGVSWKRHRRYDDLATVRKQLALAQGSVVAAVDVADYFGYDFRVPADSPAVEMGCYPQGTVPGARLGTLP